MATRSSGVSSSARCRACGKPAGSRRPSNRRDKVTVTAHPLRDGKKGGSLVSVVLPNGQVLGGGGTGQGPQDQGDAPKGK